MASSDDREVGTGRTRSRLVENAIQQYYDAKRQYRQAAMVLSDPDRIGFAAAELHTAVFDLYAALKPLADDDNVAETWESTTFWTEERPKFDEDGQLVFEETQDGHVPVFEEVGIGFPELEEYAVDLKETKREVTGFLGNRTVTETQADRLPPQLLIEIGDKLERLADALGFRPETPDNLPHDKI